MLSVSLLSDGENAISSGRFAPLPAFFGEPTRSLRASPAFLARATRTSGRVSLLGHPALVVLGRVIRGRV